MPGITINDLSPDGRYLGFDVREILDVIRDLLPGSRWQIRGLECSGDSAPELHAVSDTDAELGGLQLCALVDGVSQTIEGSFFGVLPGETQDRIVIRAVDSTCFDVECTDENVLARYRERFRRIEDFPPNVTFLD